MRFLPVFLILPVIFYFLDTLLPNFYIFDPKKLQEISKESIAYTKENNGNTTVLFEHLVAGLQKEYGSKYVDSLSTDAWFFK